MKRGHLREKLMSNEFHKTIANADVVFGEDAWSPGLRYLFFGKESLHKIANGAVVVTVPIDFETDDPETLFAACKILKGACCYNVLARNPPPDPLLN